MKKRMIILIAALALVGILAATASGFTGAYFSDTKNGITTGTIGQIKIATSGGIANQGDGLDFVWNDMLPGTVYSATMNVQNTSPGNVEDLYLTFPNATALSALNTLGRYGAVTIYVDGSAVYQNNNLNDIPNNGTSGLPAQLLLASNVGPTQSHQVIFRFEYASLMSQQEPGGVFNQYPIPLVGPQDPRYALGYGQVTVNPGDGTGNGLPFRIVATQPGIAPGAPGSKPSPLPL
jgi:hypothetical protein